VANVVEANISIESVVIKECAADRNAFVSGNEEIALSIGSAVSVQMSPEFSANGNVVKFSVVVLDADLTERFVSRGSDAALILGVGENYDVITSAKQPFGLEEGLVCGEIVDKHVYSLAFAFVIVRNEFEGNEVLSLVVNEDFAFPGVGRAA